MKVCIATTKCPSEATFKEFLASVKKEAEYFGVNILGYVIVQGCNCCNHGIMLEENEANTRFLNVLAMALMPAKLSVVSNNDQAVIEGQFELLL